MPPQHTVVPMVVPINVGHDAARRGGSVYNLPVAMVAPKHFPMVLPVHGMHMRPTMVHHTATPNADKTVGEGMCSFQYMSLRHMMAMSVPFEELAMDRCSVGACACSMPCVEWSIKSVNDSGHRSIFSLFHMHCTVT